MKEKQEKTVDTWLQQQQEDIKEKVRFLEGEAPGGVEAGAEVDHPEKKTLEYFFCFFFSRFFDKYSL